MKNISSDPNPIFFVRCGGVFPLFDRAPASGLSSTYDANKFINNYRDAKSVP